MWFRPRDYEGGHYDPQSETRYEPPQERYTPEPGCGRKETNVRDIVKALPRGWQLVEKKTYYITTLRPDDTKVEFIRATYRRHDIQVLCYDEDPCNVMVYIDRHATAMHLRDVFGHIERNAR